MAPITDVLYLESRPRRRETMVHVLTLLGRMAVGPTTDGAIAATPEGIQAYRGFLGRHGEDIDQDAPFNACVAINITQRGTGNGSADILFGPDREPLDDEEIGVLIGSTTRAFERGVIPFATAMTGSTARVLDIATARTPEQRATARQRLSGPRMLRQSPRRVPRARMGASARAVTPA